MRVGTDEGEERRVGHGHWLDFTLGAGDAAVSGWVRYLPILYYVHTVSRDVVAVIKINQEVEIFKLLKLGVARVRGVGGACDG